MNINKLSKRGYKYLKNKLCYNCNILLTKENSTPTIVIFKNKFVVANICLLYNDINFRCLKGYKLKTKEQCIIEQKNEDITMESLIKERKDIFDFMENRYALKDKK